MTDLNHSIQRSEITDSAKRLGWCPEVNQLAVFKGKAVRLLSVTRIRGGMNVFVVCFIETDRLYSSVHENHLEPYVGDLV